MKQKKKSVNTDVMAVPVNVPQDKGVQDEGDDSESNLHQNITIENCSVSDPDPIWTRKHIDLDLLDSDPFRK
jgi:hypothetical protein